MAFFHPSLIVSSLLLIVLYCFPETRSTASDSTYIITTPNVVRLGQEFKAFINVLKLETGPIDVLLSVLKDGEDIVNSTTRFNATESQEINMIIPRDSYGGNYQLEIEGKDSSSGARVFYNITELSYNKKAVSVFVQLSRPVYRQGQTVKFRLICVTEELKPQDASFTVFVKDPTGTPIRRWLAVRTNTSGVAIESFVLSDQPNFGTWSVEVDASFIDAYTKTFQVEEYNIQRFDVYISSAPYVADSIKTIDGNLRATYLNNRLAIGSALVTLTLIPPNRYPYIGNQGSVGSTFPQLFKSEDKFTGELDFGFDLNDIVAKVQEYWPGTNDLIDFTCAFNASVTDHRYNFTQTGFSTTRILNPKVKLAWVGDNVRTFKPNSVLTVHVAVMHFDGSPVQHHENHTVHLFKLFRYIAVPDGSDATTPEQKIPKDGIVRFDILIGSEVLDVELKAILDQDIKTEIRLKASRYYSSSDSYIWITTSTENPRVNEPMEFQVQTSQDVSKIFYEVVGRGKILMGKTLPMASRQKNFSIIVTSEMTPTASILVYYVANSSDEIVADTLKFFVNGSTGNYVGVEIFNNKSSKLLDVKVSALPGSYVAIAAAPAEVINRGFTQGLTEIQILDELSSYDTIHTRLPRHIWNSRDSRHSYRYFPFSGGSIDARSTFSTAGLTVITDASVAVIPSTCSGYQMLSCFDGSCYRDIEKCDGLNDCVNDWADEQACDVADTGIPNVTQSFNKIFNFFEDSSWAWHEGYVNSDGLITFQVEPPRSSMTWSFSAVAINSVEGLKLMRKPYRYEISRPIHLVVVAPDVITRGEQIAIKNTVFNNWYEDGNLEITITMRGSGNDYVFVLPEQNGTTSSYAPRTTDKEQSASVFLKAGESAEICMSIVPTIVKGEITITVDAQSSIMIDTVTRHIQVESDGIENYYHLPYLIDMSRSGTVHPKMQIPVPEVFKVPEVREHLYIPGSASAVLSLYGDVVTPGFLQYKTCEDIFKKPCAGVEQILFNIAYNSFSLKYLHILQQLQPGTRKNILEHINLDLQELLTYMNSDGSFRMFKEENISNIWLTTFALQTLKEARFYEWETDLFISYDLTNKIINFLCSKQNESGAWIPHQPALDRKYILKNASSGHDAHVYSSSVPLTAYILIALVSVQGHATGAAYSCLDNSLNLADEFLTRELPNISDEDVFHLAITAYALTLKYPRDRRAFDRLWTFRKQGNSGTYFSDIDIPDNPSDMVGGMKFLHPRDEHKNDAYAIQATAYAMLAHMKIFRPDESGAPKEERDSMMSWLNSMRCHVGGFVSTQDTMTALQAMLEYTLPDPARLLLLLSVQLRAWASPNSSATVDMNVSNYTEVTEFLPESVYGVVEVSTQGAGRALLQLTTTVNVEYDWLIRKPYDSIEFYTLEAENITFKGQNFSVLEMTVCTRWVYTEGGASAGLTVMEIDLPTGYIVTKDTLRAYVRSQKVQNLKQATFYHRTLVFEFDQIDTSRTCVTFEANRFYPVANMTIQHRMNIFDHYEPGMRNTTMYTTYNLFQLSICDVCASHLCPGCPSVNDTKQGPEGSTTLSTVTGHSTTGRNGGIINHVSTAKPVSGSPFLSPLFSYWLILILLLVFTM